MEREKIKIITTEHQLSQFLLSLKYIKPGGDCETGIVLSTLTFTTDQINYMKERGVQEIYHSILYSKILDIINRLELKKRQENG